MGIREGAKKFITGAGLIASAVAGEIHGRGNAHDAAIVAQAEEKKHEFDKKTEQDKESAKKVAAEKSAEKAEQDNAAKAAEEKEKKDQDSLAEAYFSQLIQAKLKLDLSVINDKKEVQEMQKNNFKKLAEEVVANFSKWLKYPSTYSAGVLVQLSDSFTKDQIREMAKGNADFYKLVFNQISFVNDGIETSKGNEFFAEEHGHPYDPEEKKDAEIHRQSLKSDISKIQTLL